MQSYSSFNQQADPAQDGYTQVILPAVFLPARSIHAGTSRCVSKAFRTCNKPQQLETWRELGKLLLECKCCCHPIQNHKHLQHRGTGFAFCPHRLCTTCTVQLDCLSGVAYLSLCCLGLKAVMDHLISMPNHSNHRSLLCESWPHLSFAHVSDELDVFQHRLMACSALKAKRLCKRSVLQGSADLSC